MNYLKITRVQDKRMQTPEELMNAYLAASAAHDMDALLSMISEDAVYFFSNESVHRGRPAIEAAIRRNFDLIENETYSISNLTWLISTNKSAACLYDYAWKGVINSKPASGLGRGTTLMKCTQHGWQIVHEHLSRGAFLA